VLATGNAGKLAELRRIVAEHQPATASTQIDVLGLADLFDSYSTPAETARTFEGNALFKARAATSATGLPALADDSGLAVDELNGMPGVRSARWSGPECDDAANNALLLRQLSDVPPQRRGARFVAAVTLAFPSGEEFVRTGEMPGQLLTEPRGSNGFGYDPLFLATGQSRSNGELTAEQKDAISHRGKAVRQIVPVLIEELNRTADQHTTGRLP
jgi:XTP/dITP diphosphohydrolase